MENLDWKYQDDESLARISELTVNSKTVLAPFHSTTAREDTIYESIVGSNKRDATISISAEPLSKTTLDQVGQSIDSANDLMKRLTEKKSQSKKDINFIYPRIPKRYEVKNGQEKQYREILQIDNHQITSLVDIELQCDADVIIPPIPSSINSIEHFKTILSRTKNQIQTFKKDRPIMGYIPNIDDRGLIIRMIQEYLKKDYECRIFGVDFSGSSNASALMTAVIGTIRDELKIKKNKENNEKYYLHVFNAATAKKSEKDISPVSNLLTHLYGVDSVSGTIWGGAAENPNPHNSRYIVREDYGAYKRKAIHKLTCKCYVCNRYSIDEIYDASNYLNRLKVHTVSGYRAEYSEIGEKIKNDKDAIVPYMSTKLQTKSEVKKILNDVNEIKARTSG